MGRASFKGAGLPTSSGKVSAWLRLSQGTISGSGYSSIPDVLGSSPAVQSANSRRPVNGASSNGLPTASFTRANGSSLIWPLTPSVNSTQKHGIACWINVTATLSLATIMTIGGIGSNYKVDLYLDANRRVVVDLFGIDTAGYIGRRGVTANNSLPVTGTWVFVRYAFNGPAATEAERHKIFINEVDLPLTYSNIGAGGSPVVLRTAREATGVGAYADGDTTFSMSAVLGPNLFVMNDVLTTTEGANLRSFEMPA